ncbi:MAG: hypothetical protein M3209_16170 [Acidobacteriota bacterium]|nr:hypothetical protein [Acidobacteriota bacterium]
MAIKLFDSRMFDGSRNFTDLPETVFFDVLRDHAAKLKCAIITEFITDWITKVWFDFEYRDRNFQSIINSAITGFLLTNQIVPMKYCLKSQSIFAGF